jgi:hypothetical protein
MRTVTTKGTWDQQASRAFAAELVAPRAALYTATGPRADHSTIERLADTSLDSTTVIEA